MCTAWVLLLVSVEAGNGRECSEYTFVLHMKRTDCSNRTEVVLNCIYLQWGTNVVVEHNMRAGNVENEQERKRMGVVRGRSIVHCKVLGICCKIYFWDITNPCCAALAAVSVILAESNGNEKQGE